MIHLQAKHHNLTAINHIPSRYQITSYFCVSIKWPKIRNHFYLLNGLVFTWNRIWPILYHIAQEFCIRWTETNVKTLNIELSFVAAATTTNTFAVGLSVTGFSTLLFSTFSAWRQLFLLDTTSNDCGFYSLTCPLLSGFSFVSTKYVFSWPSSNRPFMLIDYSCQIDFVSFSFPVCPCDWIKRKWALDWYCHTVFNQLWRANKTKRQH